MTRPPSEHGFTVLSTFRTCPWKYYLSYVHRETGIEPIETAEKYIVGGAGHAMLAAYYRGANTDACVQAGVAEGRDRKSKNLEGLEQALWRYLVRYVETYPTETWKIVEDDEGPWIERRFTVVIDGIPYSITIDLLVDDGGTLTVIDHKFTGLPLSVFFPGFFLDFQTTGYCWVGHHILKRPINSVVINATWKGQGKIPVPQCARETFIRDEKEIGLFVRETLYWQSNIRQSIASGFWPRNTDSCIGPWGTCEYHPHCISRGAVEDGMYKRREVLVHAD